MKNNVNEDVSLLVSITREIVAGLANKSPIDEIIDKMNERDAIIKSMTPSVKEIVLSDELHELEELKRNEDRLLETFRKEMLQIKQALNKVKCAEEYLSNDHL